MDRVAQFASLSVLVDIISCTIAGLTYIDALNLVPSKHLRGEDPCNPLYWYPRQLPDYCYFPKPDHAPTPAKPVPVPLPPPILPPMLLPPPNAIPMRIPVPMTMYGPLPGAPAVPLPMPGPMPIPVPIPGYGPPAPLPMGSPGYPPNFYPAPELPYPVPAIQSGLVPGVDGLVSADGAINILPFSDAYSDLLEKHKQKMIRRRLQKLLDEYEHYPRKSSCHRKGGCWY